MTTHNTPYKPPTKLPKLQETQRDSSPETYRVEETT